MGAFQVIVRILHYAGLYLQLNVALTEAFGEVDNHVSGNALFTEIPRDITTHRGEDVEMACSFRGAGPPSHSLEIQWWYIKDQRTWQEKSGHITNNVVTLEEMSKAATKISVVKVAGSNISHKLRLSSVKPSDEGTYECRVIDHSGPMASRYRVRAYLQVKPEQIKDSDDVQAQKPGYRSKRNHQHLTHQTVGGELAKQTADCDENCVF